MLLDTGPLVAVIDRSDRWHADCVEIWHELAQRCLTTEAVLTEASHLTGRVGAPSLPLELLLAAEVPIVDLERAGHERTVSLMKKYADVPMDYADATLVVAAEALRISTVVTLDRKGFRSYRRGGTGSFTLLPET